MARDLVSDLLIAFDAVPADVLPSPHRIVLVILADATARDGDAWPSAATVARRAGLGLRTVEEVLVELRDAEWITLVGRTAYRTKRYVVQLDGKPVLRRRAGRHESAPPSSQDGEPARGAGSTRTGRGFNPHGARVQPARGAGLVAAPEPDFEAALAADPHGARVQPARGAGLTLHTRTGRGQTDQISSTETEDPDPADLKLDRDLQAGGVQGGDVRTLLDLGQPVDPPAPPRKRPSTRMPELWGPEPAAYRFGADRGLAREDVNTEADLFREHARAHDRRAVDWHACFRTWLGKEAKIRSERRAKAPPQSAPSTSVALELVRFWAGQSYHAGTTPLVTSDRAAIVQRVLDQGVPEPMVRAAIAGVLRDPWMLGKAPNAPAGGRMSIEFILRSVAEIERLAALAGAAGAPRGDAAIIPAPPGVDPSDPRQLAPKRWKVPEATTPMPETIDALREGWSLLDAPEDGGRA